MNRKKLFYLVLLLLFVGCDNASNIEPTADKYFLKFYGQTGDQEGVDVKETPDGGFIIGGNSISTFGGTSDYLLIKTDAEGNQEWQETYDFGGDDRMTKVLVESGGYLIAGTSELSGSTKIKILRIDTDGNKLMDHTYDSTNVYSYKCNDITVTSSGDFLVVGTYSGLVNGKLGGNSVQAIIYNNLSEGQHHENGMGDGGPDLIFVRGLEVINNYAVGGPELNFLVYGYSQSGSTINLELYQSNLNFGEIGWGLPEPLNVLDTKLADAILSTDDTYMTLTTSEKEAFLIRVIENPDNERYLFSPPSLIRAENEIAGTSIVQKLDENYIVSAIINEPNSNQTSSVILETGEFGSVKWNNILGSESSYTSGGAVVLADGSIAYTGTAGLESQNKVFLVKMKSNGEMK